MALWAVGAKGLYRGLQSERVVGLLGVVLDEVVAEIAVELGDVVEQQGLVVLDELFLQGAVEAFDVGVLCEGSVDRSTSG